MRIIFILLLATTIVASAQTFDYGIKAGPNINFFRVDFKPDPDWLNYKDMYGTHTGFHAGLFMSIDLNDNLAYRQEVEFIKKGGRQKSNPSQNVQATRASISYVQFPVLLAVKLGNRFFIEGGPTFAFRLSTDADDFFYYGDLLNENFEISAVAGARYAVTKRLDIQARFSLGLSNVVGDFKVEFEDPQTGELFMSDLYFKNRTLSFSILYYYKRRNISD